MKRAKLIILTIASAFIAFEASAWGGPQHSTVGYVATRHLTPEAKKWCDHYLRHSLAYYGPWMDHIRYCEGFKASRAWHGLYVTQENEPSTHERGALAMIKRVREEMKDGKHLMMNDSIVADNIRYLIHTVGEIHCPVHVAFPLSFEPRYEETSEFNRYDIKKKGKTLRLHNFWDGIGWQLGRRGWTMEQYLEVTDTFSEEERKKVMQGDEIDWGRDCIKDAVKLYDIMPRGMDIAKISEEKRQEIWDYADYLVAKGGYRLAAILNEIFK